MARGKVYQCSKCPQNFRKARFLTIHYATDHRIQSLSQAAQSRPQVSRAAPICPYCDRRFPAKVGLAHHLSKMPDCMAKHKAHRSSSYLADTGFLSNVASASGSHEPERIDPDDEDDDGELEDVEMVSEFDDGDDRPSGDAREWEDEEMSNYDPPEHDGDGQHSNVPPLRGTETFIEHHPKAKGGTPIRQATPEERLRRNHTDVGRLSDPDLFAVAEILMTSGLSGKKRDKFLKLNRFNGCTPWKNNREFMQDIDNFLPRGPKWRIKTFEIVGSNGTELVDLWVRDTLEGVKDILFDSQFEDDIQYQSQIHWTCPERVMRKFGETWAGRHMWRLQDAIPDEQATVIPTFLASDETTLTVVIGNTKAHPVYLTIGNVPKHIRRQASKRAMILVGYLPVTKLECEPNVDRRRLLKRKLFHQCMAELVAPLADACKQGAEAVCSDGGVRRIYPVFSGGMLDFPEQCKYACIKQPVCPTCEVPANERGDLTEYPLRDRGDTLAAMDQHEREGSARFEELGLIPVSPFWADLPYVDISLMCPPDLLHQLYKGVFKDHLSKWATHIVGAAKFDHMYKAMSAHHGLRHFKSGVSKVNHWTGREIKEQAKVFLPTIANEAPEVVSASRAILDFMYLAHSSSLTEEDLEAMDAALEKFHENKHIFKTRSALGATNEGTAAPNEQSKTFHGIPKLHAMQHYTYYIRELGTPDGFNTELPERLHIPYAKQGWRASNKKEATKQMAVYIQRMEAIAMHRAYLDHLETTKNRSSDDDEGEGDEDIDDYAGPDVVDFEPMQRLSLGDEEEEEDDDDKGEEEEEEEGIGGVEEVGGAEGAEETGEEEEEEETVLERMDVEEVGTWEEETSNNSVGPHGDVTEEPTQRQLSSFYPNPDLRIAKTPTVEPYYTHLDNKHSAGRLFPVVSTFFKKLGHNLTEADIATAKSLKFKVWYRYRLVHSPPPFKPTEGEKIDVVRAMPAELDRYGRLRRPAQFDTVLCLVHPLKTGIHRYRAARVRAIFELPSNLRLLFPHKLAYVEFFTDFTGPDAATGLYKTSHKFVNARRDVAVIPLSSIRMTCHLPAQYGTATQHLNLVVESDILESCQKFFFNEFGSFFAFELLRHWLRTSAMD